MTINIGDIEHAPWNTRGEITRASVAELAESIRESGLISPITVWRHPNGTAFCIAGNRRLVALKANGRSELAEGRDYKLFVGTETQARLVTVAENLQRLDVSPIEEARLVGEMLDGGVTETEIAARVGRSRAWVGRRRRLLALTDKWKKNADRFTTVQLERIAAYPEAVQKSVAKCCPPETAGWEMVRYALERESTSLKGARFDTSACAKCLKRTGVEADLFGVADGDLGSCLDRKCFCAMVKADEDRRIAEATKGADEVVRVSYWQVPPEDETSPNRTKKHPCAYVWQNANGDIVVRWGESAKAKAARREAEEKAREADREADRAKRKRVASIVARFTSADENGDLAERLVGLIRANCTAEVTEGLAQILADEIVRWQNGFDAAHLLRTFPFLADVLGVPKDEAAWLLAEHPEEDDDEDNENDND